MAFPIEWNAQCFDALGVKTLYALLKLRCDVFVVEQQCAYGDIDGIDRRDDVLHLTGHSPVAELMCCARIMGPNTTAAKGVDGAVSIGRVVCNPTVRGAGIGRQLMARAVALCEERWPNRAIWISAQAHLSDFYASFGFKAQGSAYLEDGILHIAMQRAAALR